MLQYEDKGFILQIKMERGEKLPEWAEEPWADPIVDWYIRAFYELCTCRSSGLDLGPIPWTAILQYSRFAGLGYEETLFFTRAIRALDVVFLRWRDKKNASRSKNSPSRR